MMISHRLSCGVVIVVAALCVAPVSAADTLVTWDDGGSSNDWTDADNWNPNTSGGPCNVGSVTFAVTIGSGAGTINHDVAGECEIASLILGNNSKLVLNAGTDLAVLGVANIAGIIEGQYGNFTAPQDPNIGSAEFTGNRARVYASNGSQVQIAAPAYSSTGLYSTAYWGGTWNWTLLSACGPTTELDLSALDSINAGFISPSTEGANYNHQHITVTDGAKLDLSGVTAVTGPGRVFDTLRFSVDGVDSTLDLSSLSTIAPETKGRTIFDVEGAQVELPALETAANTRFQVTNGATITAFDESAETVFSSTELYTTAYWGGTWHWTLLSASDPTTELNLSALDSINAGFTSPSTEGANHNHQHITVTDGAKLDLSGVTAVTGPGRVFDTLRFSVDGVDSTLDLSSLSTIAPATKGRTIFDVEGAQVELPALETAANTRFQATNGATITAFDESAETVFSSTGLFTTAYWGGTWHWTLLSASDPTTELNLSALDSINAGFTSPSTQGTNYNHQHITVTDGAKLDLSGVTAVTGPGRVFDTLRFSVDGADSTLDLSSLSTIGPATKGRTIFDIEGAQVELLALETAANTRFQATNGATITAFDESAETVFSSTELYTTAYWGGTWHWTLLSASDPTTELNLSALDSINAGFMSPSTQGTNYNHQHITVTDGARLDLSGVTSVTGPGRSADSLTFMVSGADSVLDMSALGTITNAGSGKVHVDIASGGHVQMGMVNNTSVTTTIDLDTNSVLTVASLQADSPLVIVLNTATDQLEASGSLMLGDDVTIAAPAGGAVIIGGDFLHTHTNPNLVALGAAVVQFDGNGTDQDPQVLEVGGWDVELQVQLLPDHNFGFGQMVVGQPDQATTVRLQDLSENIGGCEALYLWGDQQGGTANAGLVIHQGSTLILDEINLYVYDGTVWRDINDCFEPDVLWCDFGDVTEIPYGEGFIKLGAEPCPYDLDCDNIVGPADLAIVLGNWGPCPSEGDCTGDLDSNGVVGPFDLATVLGFWGPCE